MKHLLTSILLLSFCSTATAQSSPPSGYNWVMNPATGYHYALTAQMSWTDAQSAAEAIGANLATISSAAENDWLVSQFENVVNSDKVVNIGFNDRATEGAFEWVSGKPSVYSNWQAGQPSDSHGGEDATYLILTQDSYKGEWNDSRVTGSYEGLIEWTDTLYVDGTGNGAYLDIQSAIDAAHNDDTVIVRDGTYFEHINFNGKAITLRSENGAATTIIDGSNTGTVVTFNNGEGSGSVIDGFTITNGYGSGSRVGGGVLCTNGSSPTLEECILRNNVSAWHGGGMVCYQNSNPTLNNCTFIDNASSYGAGMRCEDSSSPILNNCVFTSNAAIPNTGDGGAVSCAFSSNPTFNSCNFTGNVAYANGGAISLWESSAPEFNDCVFQGNTSQTGAGGGISIASSSTATLRNCLLDSNTAASGGGIFCAGSSPEISGCDFLNNDSAYAMGGAIYMAFSSPAITQSTFLENKSTGGAIFGSGSSPTLTNCLFVANDTTIYGSNHGGGALHFRENSNPLISNSTFHSNTSNYGQAIYAHASSVTLNSCIIWDDRVAHGNMFVGASGSSFAVTYSDVKGTGGNMNTDPLFVDAFNGDYRLQHVATGHTNDSPCIDAGDPNITPFGSTRIDGFPDLGIIDMGYRIPVSDIDTDYDGLIDDIELVLGTGITDQDTDDDGLSDGEEVHSFFTDPLTIDTDSDGMQDGTEVGNDTFWTGNPSNGISGTDTSVYIADTDPSTTTNPLDDDTDNDGLMDGQEDVNQDGEFLGIELDPNDFDCDSDGLGDGLELGLAAPNGNDTDMTVFVADADPSTTTRATLRDTDGGGIDDGIEDANRNGMIDVAEIDPRDSSDDSVYMRISPMVEGASVTFSYFGCEPGSLMVLCYSQVGTGPTFFTNLTLDLSQPIGSRPPLQINSYGTAQLGPLPIPANIIVGDQLWFQGVQVSLFGSASYFTTTNMIPVTVQ